MLLSNLGQWFGSKRRGEWWQLVVYAAFLHILGGFCGAAFAQAQGDFPARVKADTEWLCQYPNRLVGTEYHAKISDQLLAKVAGIDGVEVTTETFRVVAPRFLQSDLVVSGSGAWAGTHRVYPAWPSNVRLNTTPPEGIEGRLVYVHEARTEEIPPRSLRNEGGTGAIAVMEVTGGGGWQSAFTAGASAVIVLGTPDEEIRNTLGFLCRVPIDVPRFYVPDGPLAEALRNDAIERGKLLAKAEWAEMPARNIYALIKPRDWKPDKRGAFTIVAPFDSMSIFPEVSQGADAAVDAATALNLLRDLAVSPPARPVMVAFVDAYGTNQRGLTQMLGTLATPHTEMQHQYKADRDLLTEYAEHAELVEKLESQPDGLGNLYKRGSGNIGRNLLPMFAGVVLVCSVLFLKGKRRIVVATIAGVCGAGLAIWAMVMGTENQGYRPLHRYVKDEIAREVVTIETEMHPMRLKLLEATGDEKARLEKREMALELRRREFNVAQRRLITPAPIEEKHREVVDLVWERTRKRVLGQLAETRARLDAARSRGAVRRKIETSLGLEADSGNDKAPTAVEFLFGLDLSDSGMAAGPMLQGRLYRISEVRSMEAFRRWVLAVDSDEARRKEIWPGDLRNAVNLWPLLNPEDPEGHITGDVASLTSAAQSFGTPGVTWTTLNSQRWKVDTARDRADMLEWSRLGPQVDSSARMLKALVSDSSFEAPQALVPRLSQVRGVIVDQSPGEPVPRVPMNNYLTSLEYGKTPKNGRASISYRTETAGIRADNLAFTGIDGRFSFDFLAAQLGWYRRKVYIQSYKLSPEDGQIQRAVDLRKVGKGVRVDVDLQSARQGNELRAVVFSCADVRGMQYFDPRFLLNLPQASLLDVHRWGLPQRMNLTLINGMMAAFLEPGTRWQLILRAGVTRNRLALAHVLPPDKSKGLSVRESVRGFLAGTPPKGHPFYISAWDFYRIDERRVASYRAAGISSEAIDHLRDQTRVHLDAAEAALTADDGAAFYREISAALANEVRAYHAIRDTANDVIRGAIFLLLVLVPFSFVVERLVYATPHVYRQIMATLGIFAIMMAILWSFHPAFRISAQPLIILMAFGIIFMSLLVMSMVYSRFETSLDEMQSGRAESAAARTSRWGVATTAFRLGIANMRKRILRTTLTGITVVLVTFALLCFTSTSSYVGQKEYALDKEKKPGFTGVLVRQPMSRSMPGEALPYMENVVGSVWHPDYLPKGQKTLGSMRPMAPRMWWANPWSYQWRIHVRNPENGKQIGLNAALGLSPFESLLTHVDRVLPNWERFATGEGCYLPQGVATELGVGVGGQVMLSGRSYEVLGTYDPQAFDEQIRDVDGQKILPTDYSGLGDDERKLVARSGDIGVMAAEMESGAGMGAEEDLPRLSSSQIVILPAQYLMGQGNGILSSIAVGAKSPEDARQLAVSLIERLAFPIYFSAPNGAHVIATTPLIPRPPKSMFIPLLIAGLIIFNTMLSSIAERKREVHIYTSLGLAPLHVGFLFLAEAITYGLMGSIAGYVLGQGVATVFNELGLMGGLTLNYSGTQTVAVMLLVIGVVVVSSLVPAYLAGKLAAPSNERSWRVPQPKDDRINDTLPFTVTGNTGDGVMAFMLDYFDAHREGSIGTFSTDDLKTFSLQPNGQKMLGVEGTVWLEPYDLGVRQQVRLTPKPTEEEDIYAIDLELMRGSGQVNSWWKLNRVFIADLRKQMLGWRKLETKHALEYITEGKRLLGESDESA